MLIAYYEQWIKDCIQSAEYCIQKGELDKAEGYIKRGFAYLNEVRKNYEGYQD